VARYKLRLYDDRLGARASVPEALPATNRVMYIMEGMATLSANGAAATLSANSAWFSATQATVSAGPDGARMLRYELVGNEASTGAIAAENIASTLVLESTVELEPGQNYLMRCDRVDIPPGGIAYTHTHQGPGTRYLLQGGFTVETQGHQTSIAPGEAWFETGPDPVLAWAPNDWPGYFSRVMILPRALKGKSSIKYMKAADADKPKLQRYTIFIDEFITI
jgi:quercetin dioxygenase-like cupin family protein